jgi:Cu(I)/Ag(I) efflux system membrane fusion protein
MSEQSTSRPDPERTSPGKSPAEARVSSNRAATPSQSQQRREAVRWWLKLLIQPLLLLVAGVLVVAGLGAAQRFGWIAASTGGNHTHANSSDESTRYICPMMCTPPQAEPGRCPVCAMELVPASSSGDGDSRSIMVDPASRRVANIQTVAATRARVNDVIRAVGQLSYDEGSLKTIAAYVDGRLDALYADYTGVRVHKGDHLALLYSPRLYSSQVEFLLARKARQDSRSATLQRVIQSNDSLYESARQRLIELGMTEQQIAELEQRDSANSRIPLCAPISGTVIGRQAAEGDYVKEGQVIFKLADLSSVWLMLELFPEDAAVIRFGQKVEAEVQSLPGRTFTGRVAFIDPNVDPETRTVGVRVVIPNPDELLRVGDYAKATIEAPLTSAGDARSKVYDPELADKWISPRHPHVVRSAPGTCPICGIELVPASQFGFTDEPTPDERPLVVPRDAVLMAGDESVVYVETSPGRFEIRRVVLGPGCGDQIVILRGLNEGDKVATRGNFLIDSQMQLAGNPSLIDPSRIQPAPDETFSAEAIAAISKLPEAEAALAKQQRICPVTKLELGSMGTPQKVDVDGKQVFICCEGCRERLLAEPEKYLANLEQQTVVGGEGEDAAPSLPSMDLPPIGPMNMIAPPSDSPPQVSPAPTEEEMQNIERALEKLSEEDRTLARRQQICPVAEMPLGSMGTPIKVNVSGKTVFICCEGCRQRLLDEPVKYLSKLPEEMLR